MKTLVALFLFALGSVFAPPAGASVPCCTANEIKTIADLNYIARVALNHQGTISSRLYTMNVAVTDGKWRSIPDPDVGELLGYMAATGDGTYWRPLIDAFATAIGVTVKPATLPASAPPPAPRPAPAPPPPAIVESAGAIEAAVRAAVGEEVAMLKAQVAGLATRLAAIEHTGGGGGGGYPGITSTGSAGDLLFRSNIQNNRTQSGITDSYCAMMGVNGRDGGFRILQNWRQCGTKHLPYGTIGMDSMGDFSYNWFPAETNLRGAFPDNAPASVHGDPSNPLYAAYRGQALVISGGGQRAHGYLTGQELYASRNVMIAAQRAGQSLYFAVSPHRSSVGTPLNRALMWLEANPNFPPNPVHLVIDGELRRLRSCDVGGQRVVCF